MAKTSLKTLRFSFSLLFGFQIILAVVLGVLVFSLYRNQLSLAKSRDSYFNSYLLADELRQSSDDLTRMVRAYVATQDPKFEAAYWNILAIRNGELPRPLAYNRTYWDFFIVAGQKPRLDGSRISLRQLMIQEGFTPEELEKLNLAQKNSDGLVKAETVAFNAVKGLFDDGTGRFTVKKEPDVALATRLVNGSEYYQEKADVMQPIDDFYEMFQERTQQAVNQGLKTTYFLFWMILLFGSLIFLAFLFSFFVVRRQIIEREQAEQELYDLQRDLEQEIKERTTNLEQSKNKLKKALDESERVNKLMVGRELKMVDLKKQIAALQKPYENKD